MSGPRYRAVRDGADVALRDGETGAVVRIRPDRGANVVSFRARPGRGEIEVLSPLGIPILFPFPNRVPLGRYTWRGLEHSLEMNERGRPNHLHGLVRQRPWTVERLDATSDRAALVASIDLGADPQIQAQYPFPCELRVTITLRDGRIGHDVVVTNRGDEAMPMGYGIHPWFPPALGGARDATEARIPAARTWELVDNIPTGRTAPVGGPTDFREWRRLGAHLYDDVFSEIDPRADGWSEAAVRYPADGVELLLEAGPAYREWVLFSDPARDAIAVEPYSCVTNAVNLEPAGVDAGLIALEPGEQWHADFRLSARPTS